VKQHRPTLVAVVVTYNRSAQLRRTVARLVESPVDHIIVVDNGSTDGSREWMASRAGGRIDLLCPDVNLGGAGGFELGMRHAVESHDPDWIVVMDDDARPQPGAIERFLQGDYAKWPAVAAAARYPDGEICEMNRPSLNPFRDWRLLLRTLAGQGRMGFHLPDAAYEGRARVVHVASFVGLFLSRAAITRCGYPDGGLFLYGDDAIYTLRLANSGLDILFDPEIRFEHDCSTFEGRARVYRPLWKVYYNYRNGLILYHETAGFLFWPALLIILPKWLLNGRLYGGDRWRYFRLLWLAVWDGMRGRTGISPAAGYPPLPERARHPGPAVSSGRRQAVGATATVDPQDRPQDPG